MGVNKVILVGNLGRDPEMRHTQSGQAVATFSVATSRRWRDKDGQQQEQTEWHRVVAWARLAEICAEDLSKGTTGVNVTVGVSWPKPPSAVDWADRALFWVPETPRFLSKCMFSVYILMCSPNVGFLAVTICDDLASSD